MTEILIILHLLALGLGMASGIGNAVVGAKVAASPDNAPVLTPVADIVSRIGMVALGLLWVTGVLLTLRYELAAMPWMWWGKMLLVVVFTALLLYIDMRVKPAAKTDPAARAMLPRIGRLNGILVILIVGLAVYTFN